MLHTAFRLRRANTVTLSNHLRIILVLLGALAYLSIGTQATGQEQKPTSELIKELESNEAQERRDAAYELAQRSPEAIEALPAIIKSLSDRDPQVKAFSIQAISRFGPQAKEAIKPLIESLGARDQQMVYRAAHALGQIGTEAIPALKERLEDNSSTVRYGAALALRWMGSDAVAAKELLIKKLSDESDLVATQAAETLSYIGSEVEADLAAKLQGFDLSATESENRTVDYALLAFTKLPAEQEETLSALKELTHAKDSYVRELAMLAARESNLPDEAKVEIAARALNDDEDQIRYEAVESMIRLGDAAKSVMPKLLAQLKSDDQAKREAAAQALAQLGPRAEALLDEIVKLIQADSTQRETLMPILSGVGESAIPRLLKLVESGNMSTDEASRTIAEMGTAVTETVVAQLNNESSQCKVTLLNALGQLTPLTDATVAGISKGLDSQVAEVQQAAIRAAGMHEGLPGEMIDRLFEIQPTADEQIQAELMTTLAELSPKDERLAAILSQSIGSESGVVRAAAVQGMRNSKNLGMLDQPLAEKLAKDESESVRLAFTKMLRDYSDKDQAVKWLTPLLSDESKEVGVSTLETLSQLGNVDASAIEPINTLLTSTSDDLLVRAIGATSELRGRAEPTLPALLTACESPNVNVRKAAGEALSQVTKDASRVVPKLILMLDDPDWVVRNVACSSLARFENAAVDAVPRLAELLAVDENSQAARSTLRSIDAANADAVPALIEALKIEDGRIQYMVVYILGKAGPAAKDAIPALEEIKAKNDSDRYKGFVQETIDKIKGKDE